jgi:hypothetical protein
MNTRSVLVFLAVSALNFAAPANNVIGSEIRTAAAAIATASVDLEAKAMLQNLDYRTHQAQLEVLRSAVNGLGQELSGKPEGPVYQHAREVADLLTLAIETLNESRAAILPVAYKETVKKLSAAAERLEREVKQLSRGERD